MKILKAFQIFKDFKDFKDIKDIKDFQDFKDFKGFKCFKDYKDIFLAVTDMKILFSILFSIECRKIYYFRLTLSGQVFLPAPSV